MVKELGGLLDLIELEDVLGNNLFRYLKIKLTDSNGINLRNSVSHGLLETDEFNHQNSFSIILVIIIILKISLGHT